ncbi:signal transduction histidine kinase [Nocardioides aurantiacus]|uniref:Sensor-like histidine kinase SenX3 n=2 Tax=Nocardioides aurantiacus TaxID=86796 RepID=A0A3N2CSD0_9ACTN|nr:signal transduction histidine kinase [Nocardioides aurantiacus]
MRAGSGRVVATLVVGTVAFLLMGLVGRAATFPGATLSLVWPAAGGAVLVLALVPRRWWPAAGALLAAATFGVNVLTGVDALRSLVFVVPNVVQAFVGAVLLRWSAPTLLVGGGRQPMVHLRDFLALAGACLLSSVAAVLAGTVGLLALGVPWEALDALLWWGRNSAGALVVVTLAALLVPAWLVGRPGVRVERDEPPTRPVELLALVLVSAGLYLAVFGWWSGLPLAFPLLVPTVWAGTRFSPRVVALHSLALSVVVAACTLADVGPFAQADTRAVQALVSQVFIGLLFGLGVLLALGATERRALHRGLAAARDAAANQAALLSTVIDSMHEGLTVVDEQGTVLLQNPAGEELLHHSVGPRERLAESPARLRTADGQPLPPSELPFVRALRGEEVQADEVHLSVPERGPDRVLSVSARRLPFVTDDGLPQAVVIYHDVTAQRAQRHALESFARVLAHDLKGPLSVVEGWTELLVHQAEEVPSVPSGDVLATLDRVTGAAAGMRRLIRDLLESSTARDQQLRLADVDLHALAASVVAVHLDRARGAEASVEVGELPPVHADEALVRQLLDNLVGNAVKYVVPGTRAEVEVRGRRLADLVEVTVADRGIGIPAADREAVFTTFHRAGGSSGFEGHGIGLSVCQTIVERHGGTIVARDRDDGPGTAFVLTLPAARRAG